MRTNLALFLPSGKRIVVLPSRNRARLYLTSASASQRWRHSGFYPAFRRTARAYRASLRLRAALGLAPTLTNHNSTWPLADLLYDLWPELESSVVMLGTDGPAQKLTVQLWLDNQVIGYVKYADTAIARARLAHEARILNALPPGLGPKVLRFSEFAEGEALVTTPVAGTTVPPHLRPSNRAVSYLNGLYISHELSLSNHPWVRELQQRLGDKVDKWLEPLATKAWSVVFQHGDFAPWNVIRTPQGNLTAIDWEYGSTEGFPYLDALHWVLQVSALIRKWSPSRTRSSAVQLFGQGVPAPQAKALISLAALSAYQEAIVDGQPPSAPLQTWRRQIWEAR